MRIFHQDNICPNIFGTKTKFVLKQRYASYHTWVKIHSKAATKPNPMRTGSAYSCRPRKRHTSTTDVCFVFNQIASDSTLRDCFDANLITLIPMLKNEYGQSNELDISPWQESNDYGTTEREKERERKTDETKDPAVQRTKEIWDESRVRYDPMRTIRVCRGNKRKRTVSEQYWVGMCYEWMREHKGTRADDTRITTMVQIFGVAA